MSTTIIDPDFQYKLGRGVTGLLSVDPNDYSIAADNLCDTLGVDRQIVDDMFENLHGDSGGDGDLREKAGAPLSPSDKDRAGTSGNKPPNGFKVTDRGVYFTPDEADTSPQWICSPLRVTAMTRNEEGRDWGRLLEFNDPDGQLKHWPCPMELLAGDGSEFRSILLAMGLQIAPGTKARQLLTQYVQTAKTDTRAMCTKRTGWRGSAYVLPSETIYPDGIDVSERVLLQTIGEPSKIRQLGTSEDWRNNIGKLCSGNSRLLLSVSMAFAAPLLHLTGDESGGIHLVGMSSTGKTTALKVAASVWGGPEYLHRWRATSNGLEAIAIAHNDSLLVLDELSQVDPKEAGEIAYMLANGSGKHRARRNGEARSAASWRLLFLSAGEIGLADHMCEAGRRAKAGQEVRMVDVPAEAGHGVYENLHNHSSGAVLSEVLSCAVKKYYGSPGREFLVKLVNELANDKLPLIEEWRACIKNETIPSNANGQVTRVGQRFALIGAAGEIATAWGLTGWEPLEAIEGAQTCFRAWLERRGGAGAKEVDEAVAQVRHFIEAHGDARFSDINDKADRLRINRAGYRRMVDGVTQYLILPEVFKQEVCRGFDYRLVVRALRDRGMLQIESHDHLTIKVRDINRVFCVVYKPDER